MAEFDGVLFSDIHLSENTPELTRMFDNFVDRVKGTPYVACLGDLTEYWVGWKHLRDPYGKHIFEQLKRLSEGTKKSVWISGNRDFMFDGQAKAAGYVMRRNLFEGDFAGRRVALEHGDRFCTLDKKYQRFRAWFRRLPLATIGKPFSAEKQHKFARYIRGRSPSDTARKSPSMFGIQDKPVERLAKRGAEFIIAGHVHAPFQKTVGGAQLLVMSDWHDGAAVVCTVKDGEFALKLFDGDAFLDYDAPSEQKLFDPGETTRGMLSETK